MKWFEIRNAIVDLFYMTFHVGEGRMAALSTR